MVGYTATIEVVVQLLAAVLIVAASTLLGYLAQKTVGRQTPGNIGPVVNGIPLGTMISGSVREAANALVDRNAARLGVGLVK